MCVEERVRPRGGGTTGKRGSGGRKQPVVIREDIQEHSRRVFAIRVHLSFSFQEAFSVCASSNRKFVCTYKRVQCVCMQPYTSVYIYHGLLRSPMPYGLSPQSPEAICSHHCHHRQSEYSPWPYAYHRLYGQRVTHILVFINTYAYINRNAIIFVCTHE